MNQLDNQTAGIRQGGKGLAGITDGANGGKGRPGMNGRGELGSAFGALLQSVGGKTAEAGRKAQAAGKGEQAESKDQQAAGNASDKAAEAALALLEGAGKAVEAASPSAGQGSTDATAMLLGALQAPAPREAGEPRGKGEGGGKREGAMAALGNALAGGGQKAATKAGPEMPGALDDLGPVEMPSDDKASLPDGDALAALSALVDDGAAASKTETAEAEPAKPIAITIVKQETYLPPVMRVSPFQQVVEPLRQAASELLTARSTSETDTGKPGEIASPTKILHLELRPVELGSLTVKMRLAQGGMEIRIEADKAETARMLANDKDALREVVKQSGFSADAVSIETVHVDAPAAERQLAGQDANRNGNAEQRQGRGFDQSRQGEQQQQESQQRGWNSDGTRKDEAHELDGQGRSGRDAHRYV